MTKPLDIPDEASVAFLEAKDRAAMTGTTFRTAYLEGLRAAAPLIVAAYLEWLAEQYWNRNSVGIADLRHWL
jgi:hypothetical protein